VPRACKRGERRDSEKAFFTVSPPGIVIECFDVHYLA
jgi:hypothetical protein